MLPRNTLKMRGSDAIVSAELCLDLRLCPSRLNKLPAMSITPAVSQSHNFDLSGSRKGKEDERKFPLQKKGTRRSLNNSQKNVGFSNKLGSVLSCWRESSLHSIENQPIYIISIKRSSSKACIVIEIGDLFWYGLAFPHINLTEPTQEIAGNIHLGSTFIKRNSFDFHNKLSDILTAEPFYPWWSACQPLVFHFIVTFLKAKSSTCQSAAWKKC